MNMCNDSFKFAVGPLTKLEHLNLESNALTVVPPLKEVSSYSCCCDDPDIDMLIVYTGFNQPILPEFEQKSNLFRG
jgi:hypothetical protein